MPFVRLAKCNNSEKVRRTTFCDDTDGCLVRLDASHPDLLTVIGRPCGTDLNAPTWGALMVEKTLKREKMLERHEQKPHSQVQGIPLAQE